MRGRRGVLGLLVLAVLSPAAAEQRPPPAETQRVQAVSKQVYGDLTAAHEALAAEAWAEARAKLEAILARGGLNEHERALVQQALGYAHSGAERYPEAIAAFEAALAEQALPDAARATLRRDLASLYLLTDRPDRGIALLRAWLEEAENPAPGDYILLANAYARGEDHAEALRWVEEGLARAEAPLAEWMRLAAQLNLHAERWARAAHWLGRVIEAEPGRESDWMQLAAAYGQLERHAEALATLEAAERQGFLDRSEERVRLAQLYLYNGIPYEAGLVLERGIEAGAIEQTAENLALLANAWILARERDRAQGPLAKAAERAGEGKLWLRLAELHAEAERWDEVESALRRALARGDLDDPGPAQLLLGISHYERGRFAEARAAFERARTSPASGAAARSWLEVVDGRLP